MAQHTSPQPLSARKHPSRLAHHNYLETLSLLMGFSIHFDNAQLWQSSILFAMLWPIFLLHEGAVHNWAEKDTLPAFLLSLSVRICLLVIVYIFVMLSQEEKFLVLVWPPLVVVFLVLQRCCSLLYSRGRAAIAGATLEACIIVWVVLLHIEPVRL